MIRNLTWQQVAVLAICIASTFAAHKYMDVSAGMTAGLITSIVAFLMGRDNNAAS